MPINDSVPERRNLVVTSLAFIVCFWADCKIDGDKISLLSATFFVHKPVVLAILAWILLFGFVIRFWELEGEENTGNPQVSGMPMGRKKFKYKNRAKDWIKKNSEQIKLKSLLYVIFIDNNFSYFVLPYILFLFALLSPLGILTSILLTLLIFSCVMLYYHNKR